MTNKEKAKERAMQVFPCPNESEQRRIVELAYNDACNYKDQQFKEHLSNAVKAYKCRGETSFYREITAIEEITKGLFGGKEYKNTHTPHTKENERSAKMYMEEMMGAASKSSIKTEWREFSYIASELHRRKIETIIDWERGDIQLRDEETGKTVVFGSLSEVKAFALGLDLGVKNAENMAFCGFHSPICKEEWK